ncbi:MAG: chorismate mutase / prephenate dehydratase [Chloroflexota bacterium]|nr:chorismate mutase / prephenate dehydratase [Chloroflexota bacterium]
MKADELGAGRREIDELDAQIVGLIQRRARAAEQIGRLKAPDSRAAYVPEREREVIERVRALAAEGPLSGDHLTSVYRQIISACRALERTLRVGYFGPRATFTHQAALERFGDSTELVPVDTIPEIFSLTQRGDLDLGVVPVENSTDGLAPLTLDTFIDAEVEVCSEIVLPIAMQLVSRTSLDEIKTIYSIPIALGQCRNWVARNLPGRTVVDAVSTARAAQMAAEDPTGAAVAPALAAKEYGLDIVGRDIQDLASNWTRFYVIARSCDSKPTGRDKTAIAFTIRDHVGALRDVADVFARRSINMSSIHSRPSRRRAWDYVFFVEFAGHEADAVVDEALEELRRQCAFVKVLGSWPVESTG